MVIKIGTAGADNLVGTDGIDTLQGLAGNDQLTGGKGADFLDGGTGIDTAHYDGSGLSVNVDLLLNRGNAGDAFGDHLINIENVTGSQFDDAIRGNNLDNVLRGLGGADVLDGAGGIDTADYAASKQGVLVSLSDGVGVLGDAQGDRYTNIENVTGSAFADLLGGNGVANLLKGGGGADTLVGAFGDDTLRGDAGNDDLVGGAGADTLNGGSGIDTASYKFASSGVGIDLIGGAGGFFGDAAGDVLQSIENLSGSSFNDVFFDNAGAHTLLGQGGNDDLEGKGGNDKLFGGDGEDLLTGDDGNDFLDGGAGNDQLFGEFPRRSLPSAIVAGNDTLIGGDGNDFIRGDGGVDQLIGGSGTDTFSFSLASDSGLGLGNRDVITDFQPGVDKLELGFIDAQVGTAGDQAFSFIGGNGFSAEGQVRYFFEGNHTVVALNTAGTGGAESQIELAGNVNLAQIDFFL